MPPPTANEGRVAVEIEAAPPPAPDPAQQLLSHEGSRAPGGGIGVVIGGQPIQGVALRQGEAGGDQPVALGGQHGNAELVVAKAQQQIPDEASVGRRKCRISGVGLPAAALQRKHALQCRELVVSAFQVAVMARPELVHARLVPPKLLAELPR